MHCNDDRHLYIISSSVYRASIVFIICCLFAGSINVVWVIAGCFVLIFLIFWLMAELGV